MIDASDVVRLRTGFAILAPEDRATQTGDRLMMCAYAICRAPRRTSAS
jgi:hypothetical protein